jgi:hypothetical protein
MKIIVPTSLKDIKLSQYIEYLNLIEITSDEDQKKGYLKTKKVQLFCNLTIEEVLNIQTTSLNSISDMIDDVLNSKSDRVERVKLGNKVFGWLPKLDDMSWGEFLDLNNNISDWKTVYIAMGVLYRPITFERKGKYLVEDYKTDKYHDLIKDIPMDCVVGAMVFFWNLGMDLGIYTAKYLEAEATKMEFQKQLTLVESGVGLQHLTNSLTEMLQSMKK